MKKKYHKISNLDILCFFFCLFRLIMYVCVVYVQSRVVFVCVTIGVLLLLSLKIKIDILHTTAIIKREFHV